MTISQTFVDNHFQAGKRNDVVASHSLIHNDFSAVASSRIHHPESITSFPTALSKALKNSSHNENSEPDKWETVSEPGDDNTLQNHIMPYTQHEHESMRKPCLHGLKYTKQEDKMLKEWALQKEFPGQILMNQWRVFAHEVTFIL